MEEYKQMCLGTFSQTRSGETFQKQAFPTPRQIVINENPGKMQDMVDEAIHRALIHQPQMMSNMVQNAVLEVMKGPAGQGYKGPTYHQPGTSQITSARESAPNSSQAPQPTADFGRAYTQAAQGERRIRPSRRHLVPCHHPRRFIPRSTDRKPFLRCHGS